MNVRGVRSLVRKTRHSELGGLAGDSFHVAIWQGAISVADLVQIALVSHVLGLAQLGRLALVMSFVVLVGQLFDVRVGAAATTFGAQRLARDDLAGAAGVFQLSYLIDAGTGLLGFAVVAALSPVVGPHLVHGNGALLILIFGATLLAATVNETSITILRLLGHFRLIAGYTVALQALRIGFIVLTLTIWKSLTALLVALVVVEFLSAFVNVAAAMIVSRGSIQLPLRGRAYRSFNEKRRMVRMVMHTNIVSYARIAQVQLPTILVGALSGVNAAGVYKIGTAGASIVGRLADPAYGAILPRVARLWAAGRIPAVSRLIRRATYASVPALGIALLIVIVLRHPLLGLLGGGEAKDATVVLILAATAMAVNGALFWNIGVLYAAGRSASVAIIAGSGLALQLASLVPLVLRFGAEGAAASLLVTMFATNVAATVMCLHAMRGRSDGPIPSADVAKPQELAVPRPDAPPS